MASGTIKAVVPKSDIVDNLTTNDGTKVLSAAQGYALNSNIADIVSKRAFAIVHSSYSGSQRAVTYNAANYAILLVTVTSYAGNNHGAGMWIVTNYSTTATASGNVTEIVNQTGESGLSVTSLGAVVTVKATGNIMIFAMG